jgi:biopolymer transport protein ExbB
VNIKEFIDQAGPTFYPLLFLSILAVATIIERLWFWSGVLTREREIVNRILDTSRMNWENSAEVARQAYDQPIGRFLHAPLQLQEPDPEVFRLALEASADDELAAMRRGDKVLEAVIALAPLLGLLGTVAGLIYTLQKLKPETMGTPDAFEATGGIGQALISTAIGLLVAIFALMFYRLFQAFVHNQAKVFRKAGNELELLYRLRFAAKRGLPAPQESHEFESNPIRG